MRNSLALLGIPDLPIRAFRHVGDRRIQPQGGGGGIINEIIEAPGNIVESASETLAERASLRAVRLAHARLHTRKGCARDST